MSAMIVPYNDDKRMMMMMWSRMTEFSLTTMIMMMIGYYPIDAAIDILETMLLLILPMGMTSMMPKMRVNVVVV